MPANGDGLVQRLAGAIDRQVHIAHERGAAQTGNRQAQAGLQIKRVALARQDQAHLAINHAGPLAGHIDRRVQAAGADLHRSAIAGLKTQIGRAPEQGRIGLGRIRCTQLHRESAFGLNLRRIGAQGAHALALQHQGGRALLPAIAVNVALAEVHHPALERACARTHVQAQAHATATERQPRHALQASRAGARLQAHKAGLGAGVLHQGQAQAGVLQAQAHKVLSARALPHLHINVARGDQGGAQAAPAAVVQGGRTQPHGGQAKAAADAEHIADVQGGIESQAHEFARRVAEVQRFAGLHTGAHRQGPLNLALSAAGQVHHLGIDDGAAVTDSLVHLKGQRSGLELQQIIGQAQLRRIELEALGTGLDRQPAAGVAFGRIGRAQQRHGQAGVL